VYPTKRSAAVRKRGASIVTERCGDTGGLKGIWLVDWLVEECGIDN